MRPWMCSAKKRHPKVNAIGMNGPIPQSIRRMRPHTSHLIAIFGIAMRIPLQIAVIFAICLAGEFLNRVVGIPIPGNILGMVLLLILLCTKILKPEQISGVSSFFLNHLALFFLPPSIAIMTVGDDILSQWPTLLLLCIVLTLISLAATGLTTQFLIGRQEKRQNIEQLEDEEMKQATRGKK